MSADQKQCPITESGRGSEVPYTDKDLAGLAREGSSQGRGSSIVAKTKGLIAILSIIRCGGRGSCSCGLITKRRAIVEAGNDVVYDRGDLQQGSEEM